MQTRIETTIDTTPTQNSCCSLHLKIMNSSLKLARGQLIPLPRDNKLCHFCSHNVGEIKAHSMFEYPTYNSIKESRFHGSLSQNIILNNPFFQLDHQIDISLNLTWSNHYVPLLQIISLFNTIVLNIVPSFIRLFPSPLQKFKTNSLLIY